MAKISPSYTYSKDSKGNGLHTTSISGGPGVGVAGTITVEETTQVSSGLWSLLLSMTGNNVLGDVKSIVSYELNKQLIKTNNYLEKEIAFYHSMDEKIADISKKPENYSKEIIKSIQSKRTESFKKIAGLREQPKVLEETIKVL